MAECSTPLREVTQNFSLNESSVSISSYNGSSLHKKMDMLLKKVERLENEMNNKKEKASKSVPTQCAQLVRETYKSMEETNSWDLTVGFSTPNNMKKTAALLEECRMVSDRFNFSSENLRAAAKTFYRSLHDREVQKENGKLEAHKHTNKRSDRLRRKLKSRKAALGAIDWSDRKKEKVKAVLKTTFMSSESSDSEEEEESKRPLVIRSIEWESKKLKKYKKKLDREYLSSLSVKSLRLRRPRRRSESKLSGRDVPSTIPSWAYIDKTDRSNAEPEEHDHEEKRDTSAHISEDVNDVFDFQSDSEFNFPI